MARSLVARTRKFKAAGVLPPSAATTHHQPHLRDGLRHLLQVLPHRGRHDQRMVAGEQLQGAAQVVQWVPQLVRDLRRCASTPNHASASWAVCERGWLCNQQAQMRRP